MEEYQVIGNDIEDEILPGFRFFPTEEELVSFYLHNQLEGRRKDIHRVIPVVDIYAIEPFNLSSYVII